MTRLVDADALKEILNTFIPPEMGRVETDATRLFKDAIQAIDSVPTVRGDNPSPWIPVTERLPEEGWFLGTDGHFVTECHYNGTAFYYVDGCMSEDVQLRATHWMPLPNPPTE